MAVEKGTVPVIEVGAIPDDLVIIQPGGAELGLETFAEAAFGLGIDVDAFGNVGIHVNSWSVLMFLMFGRVKGLGFGNGDWRACGRLAAALGRAGWNSELFSASSQCGLVARFNLRR
jgi:hypothetical protein